MSAGTETSVWSADVLEYSGGLSAAWVVSSSTARRLICDVACLLATRCTASTFVSSLLPRRLFMVIFIPRLLEETYMKHTWSKLKAHVVHMY